MDSKFLKLNTNDLIKGGIVAVLAAILTFLNQAVQDKGLNLTPADVQEMIRIAVLAILAYLSKNLLTNNQGEIGRVDK